VVLTLALAALPACRPVVAWFGRDPARLTLVEVLERRGRQRVVVQGDAGPWYDAVGVASLVFTQDGHVAYPARIDDRWRVVHDRQLSAVYDGVGDVVMSAEGTHLMYGAARGATWTVVVDGVAQGAWTALADDSLRLVSGAAPGSFRWSFVGYRDRGAFAVVDGAVMGPFDSVGPVLLGARRSAFAGVRDERAQVFIDGAGGVPFEQVRDLSLVGDHVAYIGHSATGSVVVLGGVSSDEYPVLRHLRVHPSGRWFAVRSVSRAPDAPEALMVGEWPRPEARDRLPTFFPAASAVQKAVFSSDGRIIWVAVTEDHARVYVGGEPESRFAAVSELIVVGTHCAYVGERSGRFHVVRDGTLVASEAGPIDSLVVSAAGEVAYHTQATRSRHGRREQVVVARGRRSSAPGFVEGSLVCLDDAPHCAHLATLDGELRVVVDGVHPIPFDLEEAVASAARRRGRPVLGDTEWLKAWLRAELRWFVHTHQRNPTHGEGLNGRMLDARLDGS